MSSIEFTTVICVLKYLFKCALMASHLDSFEVLYLSPSSLPSFLISETLLYASLFYLLQRRKTTRLMVIFKSIRIYTLFKLDKHWRSTRLAATEKRECFASITNLSLMETSVAIVFHLIYVCPQWQHVHAGRYRFVISAFLVAPSVRPSYEFQIENWLVQTKINFFFCRKKSLATVSHGNGQYHTVERRNDDDKSEIIRCATSKSEKAERGEELKLFLW